MTKLRLGSNTRRQRGQSLVEFALILPLLAAMLAAVLEFGLVMDADMGLEAASREGARVSAVLGNDGTQGVCTGTRLTSAEATVDPAILSTVTASLKSAGIDITRVQVWIFDADTNGSPLVVSGVAQVNKYSGTTGSFVSANGDVWKACGRHDGTFGGGSYDDVGVQIQYTYKSQTGVLSFLSGGLPMSATAVMPIGPPWTVQP
jgi:Flp pilus assembly protein TadG